MSSFHASTERVFIVKNTYLLSFPADADILNNNNNSSIEGDFEESLDSEANYVETVNISLVEQTLLNTTATAPSAHQLLLGSQHSAKVR